MEGLGFITAVASTIAATITLMWNKVSMLWNLEVGASVIVAIAVIIVAIAVKCC